MHQNTDYYVAYIAFLRAAYHWFLAAHHVTRGAGFNGDHELYAEIYGDYVQLLDGAIEKSIGHDGGETAAAPLPSLQMAISLLQQYPSPESLTSLAIASAALQVEKDYQSVVAELFDVLESSGDLPMGVNDFL